MSSRTGRRSRPASGGASTRRRWNSARRETAAIAESALGVLLLVSAGFAAGVVNVAAGGGSLLTLPVLIFLGIPPTVANGTNRLAILIHSAAATEVFRRAGALRAGTMLRLAVPAAVGAGAGSIAAVRVEEDVFVRVLAVAMVVLTLGSLWFRPPATDGSSSSGGEAGPVLAAAFVLVGFYGGFAQAGVGLLSLGATSWAGFDLVRGNAIKVACVFVFSIVSLTIFVASGHVAWGPGLALGVGSLAGALVGARFTLRVDERVLRAVVAVAVLGFAAALWLRA